LPRPSLRVSALALAALALLTAALAPGAVTGGRVPAPAPKNENPAAADPRLGRRVTLQLKGESVDDFCAVLEARTRVPLRAAPGVADEKISVFVKERPAREVMGAVARLRGGRWAQTAGAGADGYELVPPRGQPAVAVKPDDGTLDRRRPGNPALRRVVTFHPENSCPGAAGAPERGGGRPARVTTAEVWEAVHRATGLLVAADFFTRLYPLERVTVARKPLLAALRQVGDALGSRWRMDGDTLLCRSETANRDRLAEVPNRYLRRWQERSAAAGGLPLADLLAMATRSDRQLDAAAMAEGIRDCWGLPEWEILRAGHGQLRPYARFLAGMTAEQRDHALAPGGLAGAALSPAQQESLRRLAPPALAAGDRLAPAALAAARFRAAYVPAGWFVWSPAGLAASWDTPLFPAAARAEAEALGAARRLDPNARPDEIRPGDGDLGVSILLEDGTSWGATRNGTYLRIHRTGASGRSAPRPEANSTASAQSMPGRRSARSPRNRRWQPAQRSARPSTTAGASSTSAASRSLPGRSSSAFAPRRSPNWRRPSG
jgi:hypothetical protein